jgi:hypothetical protein
MNDISIFGKLKNLRKLNLCDHPEFFLTEE